MRVLVIGGGGREHAICLALKRSSGLSKLYASPGNPGIAMLAECVPEQDVLAFCQTHNIELVIIGPEAPLVAGLVDKLRAAAINVLGPTAAASQLEASKAFTKQMCQEAGVPTARYLHTSDAAQAIAFAARLGFPVVIKADGLAAGKGVVIAESAAEVEMTVCEFLAGSIGAAGETLVIEEFLTGSELSFFALCDGTTALPFASAVDHKRIGEGDTGANTGGMGTISPAPQMSVALEQQIMQQIITPTLQWMQSKGTPFSGFLFAGIMLTATGPQLLEYNVRLGDPETQAMLPRLESDFLELCYAAATGSLQQQQIMLSADNAVCIVVAAAGYPGNYVKNTSIKGLEAVSQQCTIIHAGTALINGELQAVGGRVLGICAQAASLPLALDKAYQGLSKIDWPEGYFRKDIGWRFL